MIQKRDWEPPWDVTKRRMDGCAYRIWRVLAGWTCGRRGEDNNHSCWGAGALIVHVEECDGIIRPLGSCRGEFGSRACRCACVWGYGLPHAKDMAIWAEYHAHVLKRPACVASVWPRTTILSKIGRPIWVYFRKRKQVRWPSYIRGNHESDVTSFSALAAAAVVAARKRKFAMQYSRNPAYNNRNERENPPLESPGQGWRRIGRYRDDEARFRRLSKVGWGRERGYHR